MITSRYRYCRLFLISFFLSCNTEKNKKTLIDKQVNEEITLSPPTPISSEEEKRLKQACQLWYDTLIAKNGFSGEILIAKNGNIIFEDYKGTTHIPGNEKISDSTPIHIASVTKTFTATAILKLKEEGKLGLDDELIKYFPDFNYAGVTIRSLLNHRSGLPNYLYFMEKLGWDKSKYISNQDVYSFLTKRKSEIEDIKNPNKNFNYCNTNYCLLALLIEKISGLPYSDYLQTNFFDPLQMKHSFVFTVKDSSTGNPSYDRKNNIYPFNFLDAVYGDKNIYTTVRDLLIWDRALSSDKLLSKGTLQEAYTPYSNEKEGSRNYGLGWRMVIYPEGKKLIYHNGWWHGSNAVFIRMIEDSATIIAISNKYNKSVYGIMVLCNLFGNYYEIEEEEIETKASDKSDKTANLKKLLKDKSSN